MMRAVHSKGRQLLINKDRSDDSDIGQMSTSQIGVVENQNIIGMPVKLLDNVRHGIGHTAQMDRNMSGLCAKQPTTIKQGAGKIEAILDIGRKSRAL